MAPALPRNENLNPMKVLIVHASAGAGHRMAAQALYNDLKDSAGIQPFLVDVLDYTSPLYKKIYVQSYTLMVTRLVWLWKFSFGLIDIPWLQPLVRLARRLQNSLQARRFHRYLIDEKFDYVVCTHFCPIEIAAALKRRGRITAKLICVVTDFDVHRIWLAKGVDYYTAASDWTGRKLAALGIPSENIRVSGIPTDRKFSAPKDLEAIRQKLGVQEGVFTVLVATGSFGIGPMAQIIEALNGFQVMVVCGHNKNLYEELHQREKGLVKIFGLVNNMQELMAVADAMITKPGGLSISEALVSGLPMIFFSAIPGQETNNIKVLHEYGVGLSDCRIEEMAKTLQAMQADPAALQSAREKIKTLARPRAVQEIITLIK